MAQTDIFKYSTNERLGKMDVDLIDVDLVTDTAVIATDQMISDYVEIANAVSVNAGTSLLHSIVLIDDGDQGIAMDLVFSTANT